MAQEMLFPEGSKWRKWDLHIHSPLSILNNKYPKSASGDPDWGGFIDKLERSDLAVIGITDYFSIEGFKKVLDLRNNEESDGSLKIDARFSTNTSPPHSYPPPPKR